MLWVPTVTKTKEGTEHLEYQSDEIQDSIYWAVLKQAYRSFRLFNGVFSNILEAEKDLTKLRYKLDNYLSKVRSLVSVHFVVSLLCCLCSSKHLF